MAQRCRRTVIGTPNSATGARVDYGERGFYDRRNKINDLTGKEWLQLSKSVWQSHRDPLDKDAFEHPAPFLIRDIERLILLFTKKNDRVADIFMGSGTTVMAAVQNGRRGTGIELNGEYCKLARRRLRKIKAPKSSYSIVHGNAMDEIDTIEDMDYCVTSPPYHNILQNKGMGIRHDGSQRRQGIDFYSEDPADVGNKKTYNAYLRSVKNIMSKLYEKLNSKKYCTVIISDFTVNKKETNAHGDMIGLMTSVGFEFVGNTILVQDSKPLYPFGYPYAFKINHVHQYILNFRKA